MSDIIHWEQAYSNFEHNKEQDINEAKRLIAEIESSDFTLLDARDIHYYVGQLNKYSNRTNSKGKPDLYTANEIRHINMEAKNICSFDMLNTFYDDETDDVIDFY